MLRLGAIGLEEVSGGFVASHCFLELSSAHVHPQHGPTFRNTVNTGSSSYPLQKLCLKSRAQRCVQEPRARPTQVMNCSSTLQHFGGALQTAISGIYSTYVILVRWSPEPSLVASRIWPSHELLSTVFVNPKSQACCMRPVVRFTDLTQLMSIVTKSKNRAVYDRALGHSHRNGGLCRLTLAWIHVTHEEIIAADRVLQNCLTSGDRWLNAGRTASGLLFSFPAAFRGLGLFHSTGTRRTCPRSRPACVGMMYPMFEAWGAW